MYCAPHAYAHYANTRATRSQSLSIMVQIAIKLSERAGEWGLVELQGQLETRDQVPFDDMHIGDLHFDSRGVPSLIIGHHLLTGKVVNLEKPFAVLKKIGGRRREAEDEAVPRLPASPTEAMDVDGGPTMEGEAGCVLPGATEYEVIALITRKIIFKNRPKPIITKTLPRKIR